MTLPYSDYSSLWLWWPYFCFSGSTCKAVLTPSASTSWAFASIIDLIDDREKGATRGHTIRGGVSLTRASRPPAPRLGDLHAGDLQPPTAGNHALGMYG